MSLHATVHAILTSLYGPTMGGRPIIATCIGDRAVTILGPGCDITIMADADGTYAIDTTALGMLDTEQNAPDQDRLRTMIARIIPPAGLPTEPTLYEIAVSALDIAGIHGLMHVAWCTGHITYWRGRYDRVTLEPEGAMRRITAHIGGQDTAVTVESAREARDVLADAIRDIEASQPLPDAPEIAEQILLAAPGATLDWSVTSGDRTVRITQDDDLRITVTLTTPTWTSQVHPPHQDAAIRIAATHLHTD